VIQCNYRFCVLYRCRTFCIAFIWYRRLTDVICYIPCIRINWCAMLHTVYPPLNDVICYILCLLDTDLIVYSTRLLACWNKSLRDYGLLSVIKIVTVTTVNSFWKRHFQLLSVFSSNTCIYILCITGCRKTRPLELWVSALFSLHYSLFDVAAVGDKNLNFFDLVAYIVVVLNKHSTVVNNWQKM